MLQKTIRAVEQNSIIIKAAFVTLLSALFLFAHEVSAAGWVAPSQPTGVPSSFDNAVLNLTNWVLGFVAMVAVLAIVWGGVMYIASSGDENKASTGKRIVTYAIIGLVIAGIAYALVNVIVTEILID